MLATAGGEIHVPPEGVESQHAAGVSQTFVGIHAFPIPVLNVAHDDPGRVHSLSLHQIDQRQG